MSGALKESLFTEGNLRVGALVSELFGGSSLLPPFRVYGHFRMGSALECGKAGFFCAPHGLDGVASQPLFLLHSALQSAALWNVGIGRLVGTSLYCVDVGSAVKR